MKEIIYNIDNATAGRVITITGLDEASLGEDNVLGIINKTTKKVLYAPTVGALASVSYSSGTLTITLANSVTAITAGDKLLIKLYSDSPIDIDTSDLAKEGSVARIVSSKVPTVMECSYYPNATFVRVGYDIGYYKWLRVDGYDMYLYTAAVSDLQVGMPCYSSINPQVEIGVVTFLKTVTLDGVAQESTSQEILTAVENIDIDTSDLAKEATLNAVGLDAAAAKTAAQNAETAAGQAKNAAEATQTAVSALPTLQDILNAGIVPISYDGIEMAAGVTVESAFDLVNKRNSIVRITDNVISAISQQVNYNNYTSLIEITATEAYDVYRAFYNAQTLKIVRVPNLTSATNFYLSFNSCLQLRVIDMSNVPSGISYYNPFVGSNKIIDIICGSNFTTNCSFLQTWSPTEALLNNSTSLVEPTETFTSNLEKLLYNIREHIAANLPDRTGQSALTLTMSAAVKAAINGDTATANAFANKNWIIA